MPSDPLCEQVDQVLIPEEEYPPHTKGLCQDQDLDLDRFDEIIEAEDMFGNVIRPFEQKRATQAVAEAAETQEVRHYTTANLLGEITTESVAAPLNLAQEATRLVDLMLEQFRPPAPPF